MMGLSYNCKNYSIFQFIRLKKCFNNSLGIFLKNPLQMSKKDDLSAFPHKKSSKTKKMPHYQKNVKMFMRRSEKVGFLMPTDLHSSEG